jgi:hypothetical protein
MISFIKYINNIFGILEKIKREGIMPLCFHLYTIKNISKFVSEFNSEESIQSNVTAYTQHLTGEKHGFVSHVLFFYENLPVVINMQFIIIIEVDRGYESNCIHKIR